MGGPFAKTGKGSRCCHRPIDQLVYCRRFSKSGNVRLRCRLRDAWGGISFIRSSTDSKEESPLSTH